MKQSEARAFRGKIVHAAQTQSDADALDSKELFYTYDELVARRLSVPRGYIFRHGDKLLRTNQPETLFDGTYPPDGSNTAALYTEVARPGLGDSPDNPIPYEWNMELFEGKYYEQYGVTYYCNRSSGTALHNDLKDLVNIYVV